MERKKKAEVEMKEKHSCNDVTCWKHGNLKVRGRYFKGYVTKKFLKRIVIQFERTIYIKKYERYMKKKTRIHARLPECMSNEVKVGDYVEVGECRPISKIIHFTFVRKLGEEQFRETKSKNKLMSGVASEEKS